MFLFLDNGNYLLKKRNTVSLTVRAQCILLITKDANL